MVPLARPFGRVGPGRPQAVQFDLEPRRRRRRLPGRIPAGRPKGWWNIASQTCETLLKGAVPSRFIYIHALDYDRGGEWVGE